MIQVPHRQRSGNLDPKFLPYDRRIDPILRHLRLYDLTLPVESYEFSDDFRAWGMWLAKAYAIYRWSRDHARGGPRIASVWAVWSKGDVIHHRWWYDPTGSGFLFHLPDSVSLYLEDGIRIGEVDITLRSYGSVAYDLFDSEGRPVTTKVAQVGVNEFETRRRLDGTLAETVRVAYQSLR